MRKELGRREFLELGALSSAALMAPEIASAATSFKPKPASHAAFASLAPGSIDPQGWIRTYLHKQATTLGSKLPDISSPFDMNAWQGAEAGTPAEWWPWEQKGYWIDGALRCGYAVRDIALLRTARASLDYSLNHVTEDGYIGPEFLHKAAVGPDRNEDLSRWSHAVFFRSLIAHAEATDDKRIAAALRRHYLADKADYGGPARNVTNVEIMAWAYAQTGDPALLAKAEKAWADFLASAPPGDEPSGDLHPQHVFAKAPIKAHGVTYAEKAKLPAILYMHTGKPEYLRYAIAANERVFMHHMLVDGIPSASEFYRGTNPVDAHETCDITDHCWSWSYLLMATGDGLWADRIERAVFNAGIGAIRKDWKGVQYFSSPNQVIATENSSQVPYIEESLGWMAYRPNPGRNVACCGGNIHRLLPNYALQMWMNRPGGGVAAVLYGDSLVNVDAGTHRQPVQIRQETSYPFGEDIHFTIASKRPVRFPLVLRVPAWCAAPRLSLNGTAIPVPAVEKGFITIEREFRPGDKLTLTLPMTVASTQWPDGGRALEHGPLVYSLSVRENWEAKAVPKWSTAEFPEWNATPASDWNYALAMGDEDLTTQVKVERGPVGADPWLNPPVVMTAPLAQVNGWTLLKDEKRPGRLSTPPLPTTGLPNSDQARPMTLVPLGATHLRLTVFPVAS